MGHTTHHAIVVTSYDERDINAARDAAMGIGLSVTPVVESPVNGYHTFLVVPDGSKTGWADSDQCDAERAGFKTWLRGCRFEDGSSPFSWVEVEYSSDDQSALVASHEWQDQQEQEDQDVTIPKPISDAIDNFEGKAIDHWMHDHYGTDRATFDAKRQLVTEARAALEAAILAALAEPLGAATVQPAAPDSLPSPETRLPSSRMCGSREHQAPLSIDEVPKELRHLGLPAAAALMRGAAIQPAPVEPPTDAEVEAWEREARKVDLSVSTDCPGELYEMRGSHLAKGLALMRRARATGSLERLRERVQNSLAANRRNVMRGTATDAEEDCLRMVRDWIDEERGAGR